MNEDVNQQMLIELRKIRRANRVMTIVCFLLFVIAVLFMPLKYRPSPLPVSWPSVQAAVDRLEYDKALNIAQQIVGKYPKDHYGYEQLGHIMLATGDVKRAESYYTQAYELYPGEATAKTLDALRKRLQNESSKEPPVTK